MLLSVTDSDAEGNADAAEGDDEYDEDVEKQDDQVAEAVERMRHVPLDRQHVPALTDVTFPERTQSAELLVVLFYLTCM